MADPHEHAADPAPQARLEVLKTLGDNTRYAIYLELVRSPVPLSTADVAETLGLHPNTVRPHLERMREVGLLEVRADARGVVGRPQHRYFPAPDAPSLGLEPPAYPVLASLLADVAAAARPGEDEVAAAGASFGRSTAHGTRRLPCVEALTAELARLGFDPAVATDAEGTTIAFTHCPFGEVAQAHPEVVCHLHRGMVEGFVEEHGGGRVVRFRTLVDRDPCRVELAAG